MFIVVLVYLSLYPQYENTKAVLLITILLESKMLARVFDDPPNRWPPNSLSDESVPFTGQFSFCDAMLAGHFLISTHRNYISVWRKLIRLVNSYVVRLLVSLRQRITHTEVFQFERQMNYYLSRLCVLGGRRDDCGKGACLPLSSFSSTNK